MYINLLELIVIRHGQSTADIEKRYEGRADFELTDLGRAQAYKAAKWIYEKFNIDLIISSPLKRAAETAEIIGREIGKVVKYDDGLMEWNNGILQGLFIEEAEKKYPMPKGGRKYYERIEKGESAIEFRARAEAFLAKLIDKYNVEGKDKRILIVSHGGMISMLFRSFLDLPINCKVGAASTDTGIHIWRIFDNRRIIIKINSQEHLL